MLNDGTNGKPNWRKTERRRKTNSPKTRAAVNGQMGGNWATIFPPSASLHTPTNKQPRSGRVILIDDNVQILERLYPWCLHEGIEPMLPSSGIQLTEL